MCVTLVPVSPTPKHLGIIRLFHISRGFPVMVARTSMRRTCGVHFWDVIPWINGNYARVHVVRDADHQLGHLGTLHTLGYKQTWRKKKKKSLGSTDDDWRRRVRQFHVSETENRNRSAVQRG